MITVLAIVAGTIIGSWTIAQDNLDQALARCRTQHHAAVCIVDDPLDR